MSWSFIPCAKILLHLLKIVREVWIGPKLYITNILIRSIHHPMFFSGRNIQHVACFYGKLFSLNNFCGFPADNKNNGFAFIMIVIGDLISGFKYRENATKFPCPILPGEYSRTMEFTRGRVFCLGCPSSRLSVP